MSYENDSGQLQWVDCSGQGTPWPWEEQQGWGGSQMRPKPPCPDRCDKHPCPEWDKNDPCHDWDKKDPCHDWDKKDPCHDWDKKDPCHDWDKKDPWDDRDKKDPCHDRDKKDPCYDWGKKDPHPDCKKGQSNAVCMLLEDYAGPGSELTAATTYMYQSSILKDKYPEIAKVLHDIGVQEMGHMEKLAGAVLKLGGDPKYAYCDYSTCKKKFWSGEYAVYEKCVWDILKGNIEDEENAVEEYYRQADVTCIPWLKSLLRCLAKDEQEHVRVLKKLLYWLEKCEKEKRYA